MDLCQLVASTRAIIALSSMVEPCMTHMGTKLLTGTGK